MYRANTIIAVDKRTVCPVLPKEIRDEVRVKSSTEAATVLLCALESRVSVTPQCMAKILSVLEEFTVIEPTVLKMRKELPKGFNARRIATSTSSDNGSFIIHVVFYNSGMYFL